ncbi:MAG TPA: TolC family protein [Bryobacteraceae bacterium]|nr:TolC family protein [Bryobacteraceae bacterium]
MNCIRLMQAIACIVLCNAAVREVSQPALAADDTQAAPAQVPDGTVALSLDQCLDTAFQKNHRRPVSKFAIVLAEAQHRQALAGYWPQVDAKAGYERLSDPLNFVFPASSIQIPAQSVSVPGGTMVVTIPANAFAPGFPASSIQMPVNFPGQTYKTGAQTFPIPEQNVKVLDQNMVSGMLHVDWLLWDGGMRKGLREQSAANVAMMREEARRTDLEIADSVTRMYWGAVLARQLSRLGQDTLARMESTLQLTETMYKGGAGKVTRSDYLDNSVMVETVRSLVAQLQKNEVMSQAALANTMGLAWNASVQPSAEEIPFAPAAQNLDQLVDVSYQFNPDWEKLGDAMRALQGAVTTARSGYYPKLALTGELHRWWNGGYNAGLATGQNQQGWTAGVGLEIPVFDGLLTRNRVGEAIARLNQLKETQFLLRDGIALQIKDLVLGLDAAAKSGRASLAAMRSAQENRDLNERAYREELVETEKVIRSQLVEALMSAQHCKARYDYAAVLSQLSLAVGKEIGERLAPAR